MFPHTDTVVKEISAGALWRKTWSMSRSSMLSLTLHSNSSLNGIKYRQDRSRIGSISIRWLLSFIAFINALKEWRQTDVITHTSPDRKNDECCTPVQVIEVIVVFQCWVAGSVHETRIKSIWERSLRLSNHRLYLTKKTYFLSWLFMLDDVAGRTSRPPKPAQAKPNFWLKSVCNSKGFVVPLTRWRSGSTRNHLGFPTAFTSFIKDTSLLSKLWQHEKIVIEAK